VVDEGIGAVVVECRMHRCHVDAGFDRVAVDDVSIAEILASVPGLGSLAWSLIGPPTACFPMPIARLATEVAKCSCIDLDDTEVG
jgi:hypothetical protein